MSKKERLAEFNRNNILIAAKRLFLEKGIEQTTMDDISKEAEYSKSTVYVYFKSKDDIYNHIVLEHFELLKAGVGEALNRAPGFPDGYFAICDALAEFYENYPLFFESIMDEIKLPEDGAEPEPVLVRIYNVGEEMNGIITKYLTGCIADEQISLEIPPLRATFIFWAGITGIIRMAYKKEAYISMAMGVTKEDFMREGFRLLLKSIKGDSA